MFFNGVVSFVVATTLLQAAYTTEYGKVPSECNNKSICDHKPHWYPSNEIDAIVKNIQLKSNFTLLTQREISVEDVKNPTFDDQNCNYKTEIKTPFLVEVQGTWKLAVQSQYFTQQIREVKCEKEGDSCMTMNGYLEHFKKTSTCITKTATILIQFYDPIEKKIKHVPKLVPVCCMCQIKENQLKFR